MASTTTARLIRNAVHASASRIAALSEQPSSPFAEKDLKQIFKEALGVVVKAEELDLTVKDKEHSVAFEEWPGVGSVDAALLNADRSVLAFVELKWGRGTLFNCVWDIPKMAVAVAKNPAATAFLVAGAPASEWSSRTPGAEFFGTGEWSTWEDVLVKHRKLWAFWEERCQDSSGLPSKDNSHSTGGYLACHIQG